MFRCVTFAYAKTWNSKNFGILKYSAFFHNCIPTHTQNPEIFRKIGKPSVTPEIQKPGISTVLENSEL